MKKIKYLLSLFVVLALMFTCTFAAFAADYTVEVKDENNLAANKWDWATDKVGSGSAKMCIRDSDIVDDAVVQRLFAVDQRRGVVLGVNIGKYLRYVDAEHLYEQFEFKCGIFVIRF